MITLLKNIFLYAFVFTIIVGFIQIVKFFDPHLGDWYTVICTVSWLGYIVYKSIQELKENK